MRDAEDREIQRVELGNEKSRKKKCFRIEPNGNSVRQLTKVIGSVNRNIFASKAFR